MTRAKTSNRAAKSAVNNKVSLSLIFISLEYYGFKEACSFSYSGAFFKNKAEASPCVDQFDDAILPEIFTPVVDIHVNKISARVKGGFPDLFKDCRAETAA